LLVGGSRFAFFTHRSSAKVGAFCSFQFAV
jgi:hypothetical protein